MSTCLLPGLVEFHKGVCDTAQFFKHLIAYAVHVKLVNCDVLCPDLPEFLVQGPQTELSDGLWSNDLECSPRLDDLNRPASSLSENS